MATNTWQVGDQVTLTATCKNNATPPVLYDPATVTCKVLDPTGATTTYTLAGGTVTKVSTGIYTALFAPTVGGTHSYEFVTPVRAVVQTFFVAFTAFD